jgi:hypothetical protein
MNDTLPAPVVLEPVAEPMVLVAPSPGWLRRMVRGIASGCEWIFGVIALIVGLSFLAAAPVLQFLTLGYLLEAGGRVARTGRLRDGMIGVRSAARLGSVILGAWLVILPLRYLSTLATSAALIDPGGPLARRWNLALQLLTALAALHVIVACSRGGRLRHFIWPFGSPFWLMRRLRRGGWYAESRDAVWDFVMSLRLPYYFWLGLRGYFGTLLWLAGPVSLIAAGRKVPPLGFLGALLLGIVLLWLPFLQMRFATENRLRALFEVRAVRKQYRRAPWAFAFAFFITLAFAVPLYLLKIEMVPREAAWLPSLVFLTFIYPARLLSGWAYGRSLRRHQPRHWFFRWTGRLWLLPTVAIYVVIVCFTQFTAWNGIASLYQQHAFLLPVPFLDM